MFCPECKSMLVSLSGQLKCRKCGYIRKIDDAHQMKRKIERSEFEIGISEQRYTKLTCPRCGSDCQTACLGPHRIPNYDSEVIDAGYLVRCDKCGKSWYYQDNSVSSYVDFSPIVERKTVLSNNTDVWRHRGVVEEITELDLNDELNLIDKGNTNYY